MKFTPADIKQLLAANKAEPTKRLGQNFLVDEGVLKKIIETSEPQLTDLIIEIGPGLGVLTLALAPLVKKIIAIEKDPALSNLLAEALVKEKIKNVEIITQDVLKFDPPTTSYKLIANIPYYITSPIIRKFLETQRPPQKMVLLIQKEVAQRICAKPPQMSILAVSVQFYSQPKIISHVSKNSFWPVPKVDSAIIEIIPQPAKPDIDPTIFFAIVKAGFVAPRKQLINNLSRSLKIDRAKVEKAILSIGLSPHQRAETLTVEDWKKLAKLLN